MITKLELETVEDHTQLEFYEEIFTNMCQINEKKIEVLIHIICKLCQYPKIAELLKEDLELLNCIKKKEKEIRNSVHLI